MDHRRLRLELLPWKDKHGNNMYRLLADYEHWDGEIIEVDFITNLGTVPKAFHSLVTPSELREAAVVHDWRCGEGPFSPQCSRLEADRMLREDMLRLGFSLWRAWLIYWALRVFARVKGKV